MRTCRNTLDAWRDGTAYRVIARSRYADFRGGLGDDGESMRGSDGSASDGIGSNGIGSSGSGSNDYGVDSGE
ncbi:hypothetical protein HQP42_07360 [Rhodococcus fascians]|nr:hypothetical protein [Rhodococcus fascians]MBY3824902.1 hypothetical protein [Rhodococcus fascians]MBY3835424.1 hypothetical protein [Rhodococcus fascians]MBY3864636.1 hypothetical protein [Rhodococcus fascians]MBY3884107.1 hypothetical protein [Rhodococcus fascians]